MAMMQMPMQQWQRSPTRRMGWRLLAGVATAFAVASAGAQGPVADTARTEGRDSVTSPDRRGWALAAWGGIARNSPDNIWGAEPGRDVAVTALRIAWPLARGTGVEIDYVVDLVPAAWVSMRGDPTYVAVPCPQPKPGTECLIRTYRGRSDAARGFGAAPVGLEARFRPDAMVQPYATISAGLLRFSREVPVDGAATLNITADVGAGAAIALPGKLGLMLGYKFYHISNGGSAAQNPGLDSHMAVIGLRQAR